MDIAEALIKNGHQVTVVTSFPNRPAGRLYKGYSRQLFKRETSPQGYDIIRCFTTISKASTLPSRLLENVSFGLTSGWMALTLPRPDIFYVNTWPLFATGIMYLISKWRCVPLVLNVQDLYPESLISQQRIRSYGLIARVMAGLDGIISRGAKAVTVISERFADIYRNHRRVNPKNIYVIPNWMTKDAIDVDVISEKFRTKKNISNCDFVVVYGGNIGVAAGVETVISSMRYLSDCDNIRLLVAGEGSRLHVCKELARYIPLGRIVFHSPWLSEETSEVLRSADLLVLPTLGKQSAASVPSKIVSYMLSARPIIAMAVPGSDLANLVVDSGCGWIVEPDKPEDLAEKIKEVVALSAVERQRRGEMGRQFVLAHMTKEVCLPKVLNIFAEAAR